MKKKINANDKWYLYTVIDIIYSIQVRQKQSLKIFSANFPLSPSSSCPSQASVLTTIFVLLVFSFLQWAYQFTFLLLLVPFQSRKLLHYFSFQVLCFSFQVNDTFSCIHHFLLIVHFDAKRSNFIFVFSGSLSIQVIFSTENGSFLPLLGFPVIQNFSIVDLTCLPSVFYLPPLTLPVLPLMPFS